MADPTTPAPPPPNPAGEPTLAELLKAARKNWGYGTATERRDAAESAILARFAALRATLADAERERDALREAAQQVLDADDNWGQNGGHVVGDWDDVIGWLRAALSPPVPATHQEEGT